MAGRSWRETASTLAALVPICTAHDADGIDIYFLNKPDSDQYRNITNPAAVTHIFNTTAPRGITLTGTRLQAILNPYLDKVERLAKTSQLHTLKPLNIIVITDGVPSDDPESVIVLAAKRLDRCDAPLRQVGIQFFQVGQEAEAAAALQELDDEIEKRTGARDIVDTVPFNSGKYGVTPGSPLSEKKILKAVLGAVTPRLDRLSNIS